MQKKLNKAIIYLHIYDIPKYYYMQNTFFSFQVSFSESGILSETGDVSSLKLLENVLNSALSSSNYCIILIGDYALAVLYDTRIFAVFDSHARNENGISSPFGNSTLAFSQLCQYIHISFSKHKCQTQYEVNQLFFVCPSPATCFLEFFRHANRYLTDHFVCKFIVACYRSS